MSERGLEPGWEPGRRLGVHRAPAGLLDRALHRAAVPGPPAGRRTAVLLGVAAGLLVGLALSAGWRAREPVSGASAPGIAEAPAQPVRFVLHAPDAHAVGVAGSWNDWDPASTALHPGPDGVFFATVNLPPGQYEYSFVVDGQWQPDPAAPLSRDDGFGRRNSVVSL